MSALNVEELCADVERLGEDFEATESEVLDADRHGGASDELRAELHRNALDARLAIDRLHSSTIDPELLGRHRELESRIAEAAKTPGEMAGEAMDAKKPTRYDPKTGQRLGKLGVLNLATEEVGGDVEWLKVRQVGLQDGRWYLTVRSGLTREPAELKSFTTAELFESPLSKLSTRIREVRGGRFPPPRKGSDNWIKFTDALEDAAEIEEHHVTERGTWQRRIGRYLSDKLELRDPSDRLDVGTEPGRESVFTHRYSPFVDAEGRVNLNVGDVSEFYAPRHVSASDQEIASALKALGFTRREIQQRSQETGRNRKRTYWQAPSSFDWSSE